MQLAINMIACRVYCALHPPSAKLSTDCLQLTRYGYSATADKPATQGRCWGVNEVVKSIVGWASSPVANNNNNAWTINFNNGFDYNNNRNNNKHVRLVRGGK